MWAREDSRGFTIIEIMLFLVASSALLVIAFSAFNGQQQKTQFTQSVRDFEQKMRDIANDAATGYFPSRENFSCSSNTSGPRFSYSSVPVEQGKNQDCVFVGRVIHFGSNASSRDCSNPVATDSQCDSIDIYTLAGNRRTGGVNSIDVSSIAQSMPKAIHPDNAVAGPNSSEIDATETYATPYGANIKKVLFVPTSGAKQEVGAIGFMSNFDGSSGLTLSGSSTTEFYRMPNVLIGQSSSNAIDAIEAGAADANNAGIGNGVVVCFQSDYNGQWGAVTIGANGSALSTQTIFDAAAEEACDV